MRGLKRTSALFLATCAVLTAGPAFGQTIQVSDPVGDGLKGDRLDITAVKVANLDHAIITTVSVVRVGHGELAVWIQARGAGRRAAVVVASSHRTSGDKSQLLDATGKVQKCPGLRVTWNEATDKVRARVPSRCFEQGNYGAVRVRTITEFNGGEDIDLGPNDPAGNWRWTGWVARG